MKGRAWTKKEDDFLRKHFKKYSIYQFAERLNRPIPSIVTRLRRFDLPRSYAKEPAKPKFNEIETLAFCRPWS